MSQVFGMSVGRETVMVVFGECVIPPTEGLRDLCYRTRG